jgi:hypothetical protein
MYRQVGYRGAFSIKSSNLKVDSCDTHIILQPYRETSFRQFGYIDRSSRVACDGSRNFNPSKCRVMRMTRKKTPDPEGLQFERWKLEERGISHLPVFQALIWPLLQYAHSEGTRHGVCEEVHYQQFYWSTVDGVLVRPQLEYAASVWDRRFDYQQ